MTGVGEIVVCLTVGLFLLQLLLHVVINPRSLQQHPTSGRADEMVENRGSRAIGLFAIVLVVLNFILSNPSIDQIQQSIALITTLLSAAFLMVAFIVEVYGGLNDFLFKLQEDSLNYAGLLLFSGLYFVVDSFNQFGAITVVVMVSTVIAWGIWLWYKFDYLFVVQRNEWVAVDSTRLDYIRNGFAK